MNKGNSLADPRLPRFKHPLPCYFFFLVHEFANTDYKLLGASWWLNGKESACSSGTIGNLGSVPGLRRSPGGGHGNPFQCSCLENPMDRGAWWAAVYELQRVVYD